MNKLSNQELKNASGGYQPKNASGEYQPKYDGHVCVNSHWAPTCPIQLRDPENVCCCGECTHFYHFPSGIGEIDGRDGYCIVQ